MCLKAPWGVCLKAQRNNASIPNSAFLNIVVECWFLFWSFYTRFRPSLASFKPVLYNFNAVKFSLVVLFNHILIQSASSFISFNMLISHPVAFGWLNLLKCTSFSSNSSAPNRKTSHSNLFVSYSLFSEKEKINSCGRVAAIYCCIWVYSFFKVYFTRLCTTCFEIVM